MLIVGLTGPIASGKSEVLDIFKRLGASVCSDDDLVDSMYAQENVIKHLQKCLKISPEDAYYPRIKSVAFSIVKKQGSFKRLEDCIFPMLWKKRFSFILKSFMKSPRSICVLEIPLLVEKDLHKLCDYIIITNCNTEVRKMRAMKRPTMTEERFNFIDRNQIDINRKLSYADSVIDTERDYGSVMTSVENIYTDLIDLQSNVGFLNIFSWRKYHK